MDSSLLAEFSSSVPQTTGALGWTRPITVDVPAGCTFLANQVLQLDGSPTTGSTSRSTPTPCAGSA